MKRILTILLAVAMVFAVLAFVASCNSNTPSTTTQAPSTVDTTKDNTPAQTEAATNPSTQGGADNTEATTTPTPEATTTGGSTSTGKMQGKENVDFGGRTFYIASSTHDTSGENNDYIDFWAESLNNDDINNAVYTRNQVLQKNYNCNIVITEGADGGFSDDVATGTGKYIGHSTAYSVGSRASSSWYNVLKLDCDFTAEYFDQAFIRDLTVNGKLFSIAGSWSMAAKECTWIMFYNKDVYESKFSDIDIYQLVRDHEWTYDKLIEFIDKVKADVDGNQEYSFSEEADADILGMITSTYNNYALYYAGGLRHVDKDANGNLVCAIDANPNASDIFDKFISVFNTEGYIAGGYTNIQKAMENGTTLFAGEIMDVLKRMAGAENLRVGVLPQPLYNKEQESYYHYVNNQAPFLGLTTTFEDLEALSNFLELFAYHSQMIVMPAFIDSYKYVYASDEESGEMVELILNSLTYDAGYHYGFAQGWLGAVDAMITGNDNKYSSAVARNARTITSAIQTFVQKVDAVDDTY